MAPNVKSQARLGRTDNELLPSNMRLDHLPDEEPPLMLALDDLVQDMNGEVVLFNDSRLRALAISTDLTVVEEGEAGRHVTAAGEDVSGFRFVAFANGLRLYFEPGLDLLIVESAANQG